MPKVIIAAPVSYKMSHGDTFFTGERWLRSILEQDYPELLVYMLLNDLTLEMETGMIQIADDRCKIKSININDTPDERGRRQENDKDYTRFADLRNLIIDYVISTDADYFVSVDSDIITHPDTVGRLVQRMETNPQYGMIGAIVNNTRRKDMKREYPKAIYNFGRTLAKLKEGTSMRKKPLCKFEKYEFFDVDYVGACMIVRVDMLHNQKVRWGPHKHGEDLYMCERVEEAGYLMGVDTSIITLHLMDETVGEEDEIAFNNREIL